MINVKTDGGAAGDGVTNDTQKLQDLIDDAETGSGDATFYFPPGRYRIESTLEFPDEGGYRLIGCGLAPPLHEGSNAQGGESVIIWGGADGGTMIRYSGVGLVWEGLNLWGCALGGSSSSCPTARAQHGILLEKISGQVGTGKVWFDSVLIAHCDEAIATSETANNDSLGFGYYWCEDCDYALRLAGEQSLDYTLQMLRAVEVGTIFRVDQPSTEPRGGGRVFTQNVIVESTGTTVLDVASGAENGAYYQIGGVVIKEAADNTVLFHSDPPHGGDHHIRFTNGHFRNDVSVTVDRLSGGTGARGTTLELVGCRGVGQLEGNVVLKGRTDTNRVVLFVRDSDITGLTNDDIASLIGTGSKHYRSWGLDNWTFDAGAVTDTSDAAGEP